MDRQFLVQEIKRLANEDSGTPPGQEKFHRETGVSPAQWRGVYWAKWSDALAEAGFKPNSFNVAYEQDFLLEQLATAARDLQISNHRRVKAIRTWQSRFPHQDYI
jgi:hypothetical protein